MTSQLLEYEREIWYNRVFNTVDGTTDNLVPVAKVDKMIIGAHVFENCQFYSTMEKANDQAEKNTSQRRSSIVALQQYLAQKQQRLEETQKLHQQQPPIKEEANSINNSLSTQEISSKGNVINAISQPLPPNEDKESLSPSSPSSPSLPLPSSSTSIPSLLPSSSSVSTKGLVTAGTTVATTTATTMTTTTATATAITVSTPMTNPPLPSLSSWRPIYFKFDDESPLFLEFPCNASITRMNLDPDYRIQFKVPMEKLADLQEETLKPIKAINFTNSMILINVSENLFHLLSTYLGDPLSFVKSCLIRTAIDNSSLVATTTSSLKPMTTNNSNTTTANSNGGSIGNGNGNNNNIPSSSPMTTTNPLSSLDFNLFYPECWIGFSPPPTLIHELAIKLNKNNTFGVDGRKGRKHHRKIIVKSSLVMPVKNDGGNGGHSSSSNSMTGMIEKEKKIKDNTESTNNTTTTIIDAHIAPLKKRKHIINAIKTDSIKTV